MCGSLNSLGLVYCGLAEEVGPFNWYAASGLCRHWVVVFY